MIIGICFSAKGQFVLDAQVRPRTEFRNGFKELNDPAVGPAFYTEQRTRLSASYIQDRFDIKVTAQDIRLWGSTTQPYKVDPNNSLHFSEAWGRFYITPELSVKMGRQIIRYHNERIMGSSNWQPQGRSHDAWVFSYLKKENGLRIDVGGGYNQSKPEPTNVQGTFYSITPNYKHMEYLWFTKEYDRMEVNAMMLNDGRQVAADSSIANRQMLGVMLDYDGEVLQFGGEAYYQTGKNAANTKVFSHMIGGYVTLKTDWTPLTLGVDYMSGSASGSSKDYSFQTMYGSNHKFYGLMDYFYVGNPHRHAGDANVTGLVDVYLQTQWMLAKNLTLKAHVHQFISPVEVIDVIDPDADFQQNLGTELDLVLTWKPLKAVTLQSGYSQMFATHSMEQIKGAVTGYQGDAGALNNWAWFMVDFHPELFRNEPKPNE